MSAMITEVYDAFIQSGCPELEAKAAAKALADKDFFLSVSLTY